MSLSPAVRQKVAMAIHALVDLLAEMDTQAESSPGLDSSSHDETFMANLGRGYEPVRVVGPARPGALNVVPVRDGTPQAPLIVPLSSFHPDDVIRAMDSTKSMGQEQVYFDAAELSRPVRQGMQVEPSEDSL